MTQTSRRLKKFNKRVHQYQRRLQRLGGHTFSQLYISESELIVMTRRSGSSVAADSGVSSIAMLADHDLKALAESLSGLTALVR